MTLLLAKNAKVSMICQIFEDFIIYFRYNILQNHVDMDEPLVDSEGYPRQDIDVYQVRQTRHKIICT